MATASDIFVDFASKVDLVLNSSNDRDDVLQALTALVGGKPAVVSETEIEPLHGLGSQPPESEHYYRAMLKLLHWGIQNFPINPRKEGNALWTLMRAVDGQRGYNQGLIPLEWPQPVGFFEQDFVPPAIFAGDPRERRAQPIQPLDVDLSYVKESLAQGTDACTIAATRSTFGWNTLYVECICLFVDAQGAPETLVASVSHQKTLTIIVTGKFTATCAHEIDAIVNPLELENLDKSERGAMLRANARKALRAVDSVKGFLHGQSISPIGTKKKGSCAVLLAPRNKESGPGPGPGPVYALTACHLFDGSGDSISERNVITPGGLDILAKLALSQILSSYLKEQERKFLLERWKEPCGVVESSHIGTNRAGWRSDWALVCLKDKWAGPNGSWAQPDVHLLADCVAEAQLPETFGSDVVEASDPQEDEICYKDGASSGGTLGRVGAAETALFIKGTANMVHEEDTMNHIIEEARVVTLRPVAGGAVAEPGDSGGGVFCPAEEKNGWRWTGMVVSGFNPKSGDPPAAFMIPQSQIFASLEEVTGKVWQLAGGQSLQN